MMTSRLTTFAFLLIVFVFELYTVVAPAPAPAPARIQTEETLEYWNSQLHGIPMPASISSILPQVDMMRHAESTFLDNKDINIFACRPGVNDDPNDYKAFSSLYLLKENFNNNSKVELNPQFSDYGGKAHFFPRTFVKTLPLLKSTNIANIVSRFSISSKASIKAVNHTVEMCEHASRDDNECITSLESMIDFVQSVLGKASNNHVIRAFSTTIEAKYYHKGSLQPYRIVHLKELSGYNSSVSCHKSEFPYAVYLCHQRPATVPYMTTLEGVHDKTKIEAATVCHMDTSHWDREFPGLKALNATPGTPVCHFLYPWSVLWVGSKN